MNLDTDSMLFDQLEARDAPANVGPDGRCAVADETCRACVYCAGGEFGPATPADCECDGTGCANLEHRQGAK